MLLTEKMIITEMVRNTEMTIITVIQMEAETEIEIEMEECTR